MASSFITKDGIHGAWTNDALMQVVCWGLVQAMDETQDIQELWPNNEFRDYLYNNSQGIFVGFMGLGLGDYVFDEERKSQFLKIIETAKTSFLNKGPFLPIDYLNVFQLIEETKRVWVSPLETQKVIDILVFIEQLLNDEIKTTVSD